MLTIDINGNYFALDTAFSVRISAMNPACFMDKIPGDAGLGITLPVNDINRSILGSPERFERLVTSSNRKFTGCTMRFGGVSLMAGTLVVTQATADSYVCWVQSDLGAMGEALQNKKLPDLTWPANQGFDSSGTYNDQDNDYCCPILRNPGFFDGKGREEEGPVQYTDENGDPQTKTEMRGFLVGKHYENFEWMVNNELVDTLAGCVISPMLYLRYVLRESLRTNGWHINRNDMLTGSSASFFEGLAIYNNLSIVEPVLTTTQQPVVNWDYENNEMVETNENIITEQEW